MQRCTAESGAVRSGLEDKVALSCKRVCILLSQIRIRRRGEDSG